MTQQIAIVSLKQSKPIDRLYQDVADYDLVIVPDSPLADALNRRLERPHFGPFAITPRRLATRRRETAEDRTAFLEVIEKTDFDWKQIAHTVGNILQCWEYQGNASAILAYERYNTPVTRTVVDILESIDTSSGLLTEYQIDGEKHGSVAVVGEQQLTTLERTILPESYDAIERFTDDTIDMAPFRIFDSPATIIDTVLETVTNETADRIAIVLDANSEYSPLIESALENAEIPYYGGPGFIDDPNHRALIQLLRWTTAGSDTRIRAVKSLLSCLGANVSVEHEEKRVSAVDDPKVEWLREFATRAETMDFESVLEAYEMQTGHKLETFREELATLGLMKKRVTPARIDQLTFYFDTYEVPIDRENEGVLLADAQSASFVDRPLVFFLGLDDGWTHDSPNRPWVDSDAEYERNLAGFQSLMQSGVEQYYLVRDVSGGTPVTPCLYFDALLENDFERFSELDSIQHTRPERPTKNGFQRESLDTNIEPTQLTTISQSSLNTYANSPRDYCFGRLVDSPDKHYFVEGNLFHDFAEFVVSHPEWVTDDRIDAVVELLIENTRPFHRQVDLETRRTEYRVGLQTIATYLRENVPDSTSFVTASSGWGTNQVAAHFDREVDSPIAERWFEDNDLRLKGKIDLIQSPTNLIDFKSGQKRSATQVTKRASITEPSDQPNFQALLYLTYWRRQQPDSTLEFTFFHFLETVDDVIAGDASLEDCLVTITYQPVSFEAYVQSRTVFDELCTDASNACTKTFSQTSYEIYRSVCETHEVPRARDADQMAKTPFGEALLAELIDEVGDYKYVKKGWKQACRHLCRYRKEGFFAGDLDEFERFVGEELEALNRYRRGDERFPINGRAGEPNYRYVNNRDMLLTEPRALGRSRPEGSSSRTDTRSREDSRSPNEPLSQTESSARAKRNERGRHQIPNTNRTDSDSEGVR